MAAVIAETVSAREAAAARKTSLQKETSPQSNKTRIVLNRAAAKSCDQLTLNLLQFSQRLQDTEKVHVEIEHPKDKTTLQIRSARKTEHPTEKTA